MTAHLTFLSPPPGFAPHTEFVLDDVSDADGLFTLRAADEPGLRVFLVDPQSVAPDYRPVIDDSQVADLGLDDPSDALVLVVANPSLSGVRVNLLAPVIVNTSTGQASQVILDDESYELAVPLMV